MRLTEDERAKLFVAVCSCSGDASECYVREEYDSPALHAAVEAIVAARLSRVEALADEITRWSEGVESETSASVGRWVVRRITAALAPVDGTDTETGAGKAACGCRRGEGHGPGCAYDSAPRPVQRDTTEGGSR